jgi:hypothetical protein
MHSTHINLSMKDRKKLCNNCIFDYKLPVLLVAVICFFVCVGLLSFFVVDCWFYSVSRRVSVVDCRLSAIIIGHSLRNAGC